MHLSLLRPREEVISSFLEGQVQLPFSYPEVGATAGVHPAGYLSNRVRVPLGAGEMVYRRACDGLRRWVQFEVGWVEVFPSETPLETGRTVAILVRVWGIWSLHACRIVQVIDDQPSDGPWRFGFIYGTLPGHAEIGEERFLIEWDRASGGVSYDVSAFFRPNHWIVRLTWSRLRHRMNRFRRESAEVMQAVADGRR